MCWGHGLKHVEHCESRPTWTALKFRPGKAAKPYFFDGLEESYWADTRAAPHALSSWWTVFLSKGCSMEYFLLIRPSEFSSQDFALFGSLSVMRFPSKYQKQGCKTWFCILASTGYIFLGYMWSPIAPRPYSSVLIQVSTKFFL